MSSYDMPARPLSRTHLFVQFGPNRTSPLCKMDEKFGLTLKPSILRLEFGLSTPPGTTRQHAFGHPTNHSEECLCSLLYKSVFFAQRALQIIYDQGNRLGHGWESIRPWRIVGPWSGQAMGVQTASYGMLGLLGYHTGAVSFG